MDLLRDYKQQHGHCKVPYSYKTVTGYRLGDWSHTQRVAYENNTLKPTKIAQLNAIGFAWRVMNKWQIGFDAMLDYKQQHGDCIVPCSYKTATGYQLGYWSQRQRLAYSNNTLKQTKIDQLNVIGFLWSSRDKQWQIGFAVMLDYKKQHGDCRVPHDYETATGFKLGVWVHGRRRDYVNKLLLPSKIDQLNAIGFVWNCIDDSWQLGLAALIEYKQKYGDCLVPLDYDKSERLRLGHWVRMYRGQYWSKRIAPERMDQLNTLGFNWGPTQSQWDQGINALIAYKKCYGDTMVPFIYVTASGLSLGHWVRARRTEHLNGILLAERVDQLNALDFVWHSIDYRWQLNIEALMAFKQEHGHCLVLGHYKTKTGSLLGQWVKYCRTEHNANKLAPNRVAQLNAMAFIWNSRDYEWEVCVDALIAYKLKHGDCLVPLGYETASGNKLGSWARGVRIFYCRNNVVQKRIDQLNALGFVWKLKVSKMDVCIQTLTVFSEQNAGSAVPVNYQTKSGYPLWYRLDELRAAYKRNALTQEMIRELNSNRLSFFVTGKRAKLKYVPKLK